MAARTIMIQGTRSDAGESTLQEDPGMAQQRAATAHSFAASVPIFPGVGVLDTTKVAPAPHRHAKAH